MNDSPSTQARKTIRGVAIATALSLVAAFGCGIGVTLGVQWLLPVAGILCAVGFIGAGALLAIGFINPDLSLRRTRMSTSTRAAVLDAWSNGARHDGLREMAAELTHAAGQLDDVARSGRGNPEIAVALLSTTVDNLDRLTLQIAGYRDELASASVKAR